MKKIILGILVALSVCSSLSAKNSEALIVDEFQEILFQKNPVGKVLQVSFDGNLYKVDVAIKTPNGISFLKSYVTKDKKTMINGMEFSLVTKKPTTTDFTKEGKERLTAFKKSMAKDVEKLAKEAPLKFGKGKDVYYVFTDPDCPFCKRFDKVMRLVESNATFYIFPMHLNIRGHYQESVDKILLANKKDRAKVMEKIIASEPKKYELKISDKQKKELEARKLKISNIATSLGVNGTPTVLDEFGMKVNWNILLKKYNIKPKPSASLSSDIVDLVNKKISGALALGDSKTEKYLFFNIDSPSKPEVLKNIIENKNIKIIPISKNPKSIKVLDFIMCDNEKKHNIFMDLVQGKQTECFSKKDAFKECVKGKDVCAEQLYAISQISKKLDLYMDDGYLLIEGDVN